MADGETVDPFAPARLGPKTLRNRVIKAATFEGMTPGGVPGERLQAFHTRLAEGGVLTSDTAPVATAYAARWLTTRVLPLPAPAMIATGPVTVDTASR